MGLLLLPSVYNLELFKMDIRFRSWFITINLEVQYESKCLKKLLIYENGNT